MEIRCFIDVDGHIWSIDKDGKTNFPSEIKIDGEDVLVLGPHDGEGQFIEETYQLWPSLTSLALAIEQKIQPSIDGSVSLNQAVAEAHIGAEIFKAAWLKGHMEHPDRYPLAFPEDNAGLWREQMADHLQSDEN